jgi:hypothetical protein
MDWLTAFGLLVGTAFLAWCTFWAQTPFFVLLAAAITMLASIHRFMHGAWLLGLIEAVWAALAFRRWLRLTSGVPAKSLGPKL